MQANHGTQSILTRELKIVPTWAWVLAGLVFVAAQIYFNIAMAHHADAPPTWSRPLLGLAAGIGGVCYLLLIGYVNRDSKRRGMSPLLWTLVAILVPNLLGILLYFVLRQPLVRACPQCGNAVQTVFNFCPRCSYKLAPSCPQCQHIVGVNDDYCPYCGTSLCKRQSTATHSPVEGPG